MTDDRRRDDDRLARIEAGVAAIQGQMVELRVNVEHRVTKLETRAALSGFLGGVVASALASIITGVILTVLRK